jgi:hypothetical protein
MCYRIFTCFFLLAGACASDSYIVTLNQNFGGGVGFAACGSATARTVGTSALFKAYWQFALLPKVSL